MTGYTYTMAYGLVLSEQHFTAIGKVAAVWQTLETAVQMTIWAALGMEADQGRLVTGAQRFDTHLDVMGILALTVRQSEQNPVDIAALIKRTKELQGKRNDIVHGLWNPWSDHTAPQSLKIRLKAPANPPTYTPEQMIAVADQIYLTQNDWLSYAVARIEQRQKSAPQAPPPASPQN